MRFSLLAVLFISKERSETKKVSTLFSVKPCFVIYILAEVEYNNSNATASEGTEDGIKVAKDTYKQEDKADPQGSPEGFFNILRWIFWK